MHITKFYQTLLIVLLFPIIGLSQEKKLEECNCSVAFSDLVEKLEHNYIGLALLESDPIAKEYKKRKAVYLKKSENIEGKKCTAFLNEFIRIFKDGHLFAFEMPKYSTNEINQFKATIKEAKLSSKEIQNYLSKLNSTKEFDPLEGEWTDGTSNFIIVKIDHKYKTYVTQSSKEGIEAGELKAAFSVSPNGLEGIYYSYQYSPRFISGGLFKESALLTFSGGVVWSRLNATSLGNFASVNVIAPKAPTIKKIDPFTSLITIPSFLVEYKQFKALIAENRATLLASEYIIIDIRGNRGGNGIYFPLIKLYATKNMPESQGLVLASNGNLSYFDHLAKNASSKIYKPLVERITEHMGEIVDGPLYPGKKFQKPKSKIQQVAILSDRACMSAAESFIIHSKKSSDKVLLFGSPTAGVIDYTSVNSLQLDSGKQNIYFGYPTSTLHKKIPKEGYNETGIIPDVPIPVGEKDKINFILNYLKRK